MLSTNQFIYFIWRKHLVVLINNRYVSDFIYSLTSVFYGFLKWYLFLRFFLIARVVISYGTDCQQGETRQYYHRPTDVINGFVSFPGKHLEKLEHTFSKLLGNYAFTIKQFKLTLYYFNFRSNDFFYWILESKNIYVGMYKF